MAEIESTPAMVEAAYERMAQRIETIRKRLGRPLTFSEKVTYGHVDDPASAELDRGKSYIYLRPDRVAMQDVTAQMAVLQFMSAGIPTTKAPTTIHCDHLIQAKIGSVEDLKRALVTNAEVNEFLESAARKYGIGFWKPGAGIIHQVVLEQYAFPGGMMLGTDSHTPNAGGLGMFAAGVGGADAVDVMAGFPWEVLHPGFIGVKLTGRLDGWTSSKDVILKVCGLLTVKGGTNSVIEYFGPGARTISATGKGTICNMGAEVGATTSLFPYDERMRTYLHATRRGALAELADAHSSLLAADPEVEEEPQKFFDRVIEIDLDELEPHLVGPHTPDLARPVSGIPDAVRKESYPTEIKVALIGSCTNSSYEDITRAADVAKQMSKRGLRARIPLMVTPGSEQIFKTIQRDGQMKALEDIGATVLANACGPCIGQWARPELKKDEPNVIITSYNRNFPGRNDGNRNTLAFMGSPETVIAYALTGRLDTDPLHEEVDGPDGKKWRLSPPAPAPEVPAGGFIFDRSGYVAPVADGGSIEVVIREESTRLQRLEPFPAWDGRDIERAALLLKAKGKCTTDHISPAGPWLTYRGHLDKISDNMFTGAINAFTGETGRTKNLVTGARDDVPTVARAYRAKGLRWVVVGDENYGEGSSREHAAMEPRYLGAAAIIVRSFARIHETNLKKQGLLPLTFADPRDYDRIMEDDHLSIAGLSEFSPGRPFRATLHHADGTEESFDLRHSFNASQIEWFRAGSALNVLRGPR